MSLNPSAAVFVPSTRTMQLVQTPPVPPSLSYGQMRPLPATAGLSMAAAAAAATAGGGDGVRVHGGSSRYDVQDLHHQHLLLQQQQQPQPHQHLQNQHHHISQNSHHQHHQEHHHQQHHQQRQQPYQQQHNHHHNHHHNNNHYQRQQQQQQHQHHHHQPTPQQQGNPHGLPPPHLAPLYINDNSAVDRNNNNNNRHYNNNNNNNIYYDDEDIYEEDLQHLQDDDNHMFLLPPEEEITTVDDSNFDMPFFFYDMMSADMDDFNNYLPDRAEYLLSYARTSQENLDEMIDSIIENGLPRNVSDNRPERAAKLAAEMADTEAQFLQQLLQRIIEPIRKSAQRLRNLPRGHGLRDDRSVLLCIFLGRLLHELHLGRCVQLPNEAAQFPHNACVLFTELLKKTAGVEAAVVSLSFCFQELRLLVSPPHLDAMIQALQRANLKPRDHRSELAQRLFDLQRMFTEHRFPTMESCTKSHRRVPVVELNEEESADFEQFLRESSAAAANSGFSLR